jgi:hypothetical protein
MTIAQMCMTIYRARFLPEKTIPIVPEFRNPISNSKVANEWLLYNFYGFNEDTRIYFIDFFQEEESPYLSDEQWEEIEYTAKYGYLPRRTFHSIPTTTQEYTIGPYSIDGYVKDNVVFEFLGCYWHGCKKCFPHRYGKNVVKQKKFE